MQPLVSLSVWWLVAVAFLQAQQLRATTPSGNDEQNCKTGLQVCRDIYDSQRSNLVNAPTACSQAKEYLTCVYVLSCAYAKRQRNGILKRTNHFLRFSSPNCNVTTHVERLLTRETEAPKDCLTQYQECQDIYDEKVAQLLDPDTACATAKQFLSCVHGMSCKPDYPMRYRYVSRIKMHLRYSSPQCEIPALKLDEHSLQSTSGDVDVQTTVASVSSSTDSTDGMILETDDDSLIITLGEISTGEITEEGTPETDSTAKTTADQTTAVVTAESDKIDVTTPSFDDNATTSSPLSSTEDLADGIKGSLS
ncbi:hypothetical protein ElyMa_002330100 [Elysia marginata]|uniref:Uncharacterized protein n=1 Tax=Elysia marginata TaxID=1093978 RepID=A0AAV4G6F7_9GAST|nr:hypothetical protein ElyMa_002330100 [Elysia marginata]